MQPFIFDFLQLDFIMTLFTIRPYCSIGGNLGQGGRAHDDGNNSDNGHRGIKRKATNPQKKQNSRVAEIRHVSVEQLKKKTMERHAYQVAVHDKNFFNNGRSIEDAFEEVVREVVNEILDDIDYDPSRMGVGFNFIFGEENSDRRFFINVNYMDVEAGKVVTEILRRLESSFQSGDRASFGSFEVKAIVFRVAKGNGLNEDNDDEEALKARVFRNTNELIPLNVNFNHKLISKKHLLGKKHPDPTVGCAFRAFILYKKTVIRGLKATDIHDYTLEKEAMDLAKMCNVEYDKPFVVTNFEKIEELEKCRIIVFGPDGNRLKILYIPSNEDRNDPLYIIGHDGNDHYYAIDERKLKLCFSNTSKQDAYRSGIFCTYCYMFNINNISHKLDCDYYRCSQCLDINCRGRVEHDDFFQICKQCNREFYTADCLQKHIANDTCKKIKICTLCLTQIKATRFSHFKHDCTMAFCTVCKEKYKPKEDEYHICYMKKKSKSKNTKGDEGPEIYTCYYDIETYQQDKGLNEKKRKIVELVPYLLVCQMICNLCKDKEYKDTEQCNYCGPRTRVFKSGIDNKKDVSDGQESDEIDENCPVNQFVKFIIDFSSKHSESKVVVAAHNGGKFDHIYVYGALLTHPNSNSITGNPIKRGNKIITMGANNNIVFRDTLLFTPCPLKSMPRCMGISDPGLGKGFFPYTFLNKETLDYEGDIPSKSWFETQRMSDREKEDFEEYHNSFKGKRYNIFEECKKYCIMDVDILRKCFEKFRDSFIEAFEIDCLANCSTIAALCFTIYKNKFMPENKITILARENPKRFTFDAIKWLMYQEKILNIDIRHARNGGEKGFKIKNAWLYPDGFGYVNGVKTAFLYHGCVWHGHRGCKKGQGLLHDMTAADRYNITMKQEERYVQDGFKVVRIWECDWNNQKQKMMQDPDNIDKEISINKYVNRISHDAINNKLVIDDSLFGGRTEPFVHYYPPTPGKKIWYLDYTSLYPFVQKWLKYPCGPPNKLIGDKVPDIKTFIKGLEDAYFGISYVKILPPQDLVIPVLPVRVDKRLMFPLCYTCVTEKCENCEHNEDERAIKGTYTTPEIQQALEMGYKLLKVYEVWAFKEKEFLFEEYVNHFLKIKTEASGPPSGISEDGPEFDRKLKEFASLYKIKGVELDLDNLKKNPGMRFIAKLCLNSLWGKFAQNMPRREDVICSSDKEVIDLIKRADIEVPIIVPVGNKFLVTTIINEYGERSSTATNIPIASFTTSYARIKLYELLNKVKHRALYCDTDSCIFVAGENDEVPATGNFLGELTDEITEYGKGAYGESFVCTGPKSYSVRVRKGNGSHDHIVKAKGLTINKDTKDIINFEKLLKLVIERHTEKGMTHEESLYEDIKEEDVTVKAMNDIELEDEGDEEEQPHKKVARIDESLNPKADLHGSDKGGLSYNVPTSNFEIVNGVSIRYSKGSKKMQMTANKRIVVKNSFRTVPFGFKGKLYPI